MNWNTAQTAIALALTTPDNPVPLHVRTTSGRPSVKRFNVYRNNIAVSLTEALAAGFPVTCELVGEEFFRAMASVYVRDNKPDTPVMITYGETFPEFVKNFAPAQSVPYLSDVATLEWKWTKAYHARDEESVSIDILQTLPPEELANVVFTLHPSLHLIRSNWPVLSIWSAHHEENSEEKLSSIDNTPEYGLVVRPYLEVKVMVVHAPLFAFCERLARGISLGEAFEQIDHFDQEDLGNCLQFLFQSGIVTAIEHNTQE